MGAVVSAPDVGFTGAFSACFSGAVRAAARPGRGDSDVPISELDRDAQLTQNNNMIPVHSVNTIALLSRNIRSGLLSPSAQFYLDSCVCRPRQQSIQIGAPSETVTAATYMTSHSTRGLTRLLLCGIPDFPPSPPPAGL